MQKIHIQVAVAVIVEHGHPRTHDLRHEELSRCPGEMPESETRLFRRFTEDRRWNRIGHERQTCQPQSHRNTEQSFSLCLSAASVASERHKRPSVSSVQKICVVRCEETGL